VVAALLGAWKTRRAPLLLDPSSRVERVEPGGPGRRATVLVPSGERDGGTALAVREERSAPIDPEFPVGETTEVAFLTSGSTGEPKRTSKRGYQLAMEFEAEPGWLHSPRPCNVLCLVPPYHILGYIYGLYLPAATGGRTCFVRGGTPQAWVERIRARPPDLVVGVPSHYRLLNGILREPLPPSTFLSSGAPLPPEVGERFLSLAGRRIVQVYGSTETGGIATRDREGPWTPLPGLEWRVERGDGLLAIRSPWQERPASWHRTDDLAEDARGGFLLHGRADSIVKVGGRRFSSGEIVKAALSHPAVDQAYAVTYGRYGEPAVALFVTVVSGVEATTSGIRGHLAERLSAFKVPRTIQILEQLPTKGSGKVDAEALRDLVSTPGADGGPSLPIGDRPSRGLGRRRRRSPPPRSASLRRGSPPPGPPWARAGPADPPRKPRAALGCGATPRSSPSCAWLR
jgi:acyl-coenzyme A synthetase/AMP-(fatty) acid ligase